MVDDSDAVLVVGGSAVGVVGIHSLPFGPGEPIKGRFQALSGQIRGRVFVDKVDDAFRDHAKQNGRSQKDVQQLDVGVLATEHSIITKMLNRSTNSSVDMAFDSDSELRTKAKAIADTQITTKRSWVQNMSEFLLRGMQVIIFAFKGLFKTSVTRD
ncbi:unnamed protein product [Notodromas monacha]|uniref:Uncharacterized protein n=1 Tax=Notodromas monacha TaxID=399045 RepID=A0A7R9BSJ7_9CRUS|nr:unnamed protein product [Notodromas monacha]CAG0920933.1 unnamed protein product [Notodromas monacha]